MCTYFRYQIHMRLVCHIKAEYPSEIFSYQIDTEQSSFLLIFIIIIKLNFEVNKISLHRYYIKRPMHIATLTRHPNCLFNIRGDLIVQISCKHFYKLVQVQGYIKAFHLISRGAVEIKKSVDLYCCCFTFLKKVLGLENW